MKKWFILILVSLSSQAWSKENVDNNFSSSDSEVKTLSAEELSYRLHISGEIFIVNSEGDRLINMANESRDWQINGPSEKPIESNWKFQQKGLPTVALKQKWSFDKDGKISVEVAQFENIERANDGEIKYGKLIREEKFQIKNFAPIDWPLAAGERKLIVRLTPGIWQNQDPIDISSLPISGRNIVIFDKAGRLWSDMVTPDHPSTYLGITTHLGSLFISFKPFKSAKLLGEAKGGRMRLKTPNGSVVLQSETPFLPKDVKANVYGIVKMEIKSDRLNSVRTYSSDKEEEFLRGLAGK